MRNLFGGLARGARAVGGAIGRRARGVAGALRRAVGRGRGRTKQT